ncbi:MAG: hypothetical protein ABFC62_12640 [Clostridiaceae bacterium]|nr:hypothetical protein [Eubacteriales bacterium]
MANLGMGPSKIMIHKATEFSREASNMLKSAEQAQALAQKAANAQANALQSTVQDVNKAEAAAISRDNPKKKDGGARRGRGGSDANQEADDIIIAEADVGTEKHLLDIRI